MNIKQIRYFASVCTCGSLSAAAKEQFVTVQAVSKAIADLERELEGDLFIRESRGVRATPFGKSFYANAVPVLQGFQELEDFALGGKPQRATAMRLLLCTPPFYGNEQACASIASFIGKNLGIPTTISVGSLPKASLELCEGLHDALITVGTYDSDEVTCVPLGTIAPGVIMASNHPLAHQKTVSIADIRAYPSAVLGDFETFNNAILAEYPRRGLDVEHGVMATEEFGEYLMGRQGLVFAAGVAAIGEMFPHTALRLISPEDAISIPICLVSPRMRKSPAYLALEVWLTQELTLYGGDLPKKIAALATATRPDMRRQGSALPAHMKKR